MLGVQGFCTHFLTSLSPRRQGTYGRGNLHSPRLNYQKGKSADPNSGPSDFKTHLFHRLGVLNKLNLEKKKKKSLHFSHDVTFKRTLLKISISV